MKKHVSKILGAIALALGLALVPTAGVKAVTISPPYFDYSLNPGDTVLDVIKVYNEDDQPITLYPLLENFTYRQGDEEGTPEFYPADQDPSGTAVAKWITLTDSEPITLQPQQRANIQFALNVPADKAQPGGHFGAVILSTQPPSAEGGKVAIGQQIAALILVRVSGDVKEVGGIAEFGFKEKKLWYNYLPVDFYLRFENAGNTHLRPTGNLFIKNWLGQQVAALKVNEPFTSVLPLSIRRYEFGWRHTNNLEEKDFVSQFKNEWRNFALGKYKATLVLNYGQTGQVVVEEREFTVWPWRLMTVFGLGALVVLLIATVLMKVYNKAVIRKYELMKAKEKK